MLRIFLALMFLLFFTEHGAAQQPPSCSEQSKGQTTCQAGVMCRCAFTGGSMTGTQPGYRWDCSLAYGNCPKDVPATLENAPSPFTPRPEPRQTFAPPPNNPLASPITTTASSAPRTPAPLIMHPRMQIKNSAGPIIRFETSPDHRFLAIVSADNVARVWDMEKGRQANQIAIGAAFGSAHPFAVGGDRQRLIASGADDGRVVLWNSTQNTMLWQYRGHQGPVAAIKIAPNAATVASGGVDRVVRLWDAATGRLWPSSFAGLNAPVTALAFSPTGKQLAAASRDGSARVWTIPNGAPQSTLAPPPNAPTAPLTAISFLDEERIIGATASGMIHVWSASTGAPLKSWKAEDAPITGMNIGQNGAIISITGGAEARLWSPDGAPLGKIRDSNRISTIALAPSGAPLSGGADGQVRAWDSESGRLLAQMILTKSGWSATDPDGRFDGNEEGLQNLSWKAEHDSYDVSNFSDPYYEPGLFAKALNAPKSLLTTGAAPVEKGVGTPPYVTLTVASGTTVAVPGPTTITIAAEDQGGGVSSVQLLHNGKSVSSRTATGEQRVDRKRIVTFQVNLIGGENQFRARAFSDTRIEGKSATLTVNVTSASAKPTLHFLVVGVNQYTSPEMTLNYAVADAKGLLDWVQKQNNHGFSKVEIHPLFDRAATRAAILDQFTVLQNTKSEDTILIYFAGHGENVKGTWYFLPTDFDLAKAKSIEAIQSSSLSSRIIIDSIVKMSAQRVILLIDACKSGGINQAFAADADRKDLHRIGNSAGIHVLAATDKDQFAVELTQLGHGVFTYALLEGLNGKATPPSEKLIRAKDVLSYAVQTVPAIASKYTNEEQSPTMFSLGNNFEIVQKKR
ncbi:putative WD_REPEATS_REGION domain-containing protein [Azospirillaceae bacterium]